MALFLGLCALLLAEVVGNQLNFTANPNTVQFSVTSSLEMNCSLTESSTSPPTSAPTTTTGNTGLVGRRDAPDAEIPKQVEATAESDDLIEISKELKSVSTSRSQKEAIAHVTSIAISRDGEVVASVTSFTAARLETDVDKINGKVSGGVSGTSGEMGFLSLQWSFPTVEQAGAYTCTVRGITTEGHDAGLTQTVGVQAADVSLADMVKEVHGLKRLLSDQNSAIENLTMDNHNTVTSLQADISNQTSTISALQNTIASQQQTINKLKANSVHQNDTIEALKSRANTQQLSLYDFQTQLADALHIEQGTLSCGRSTDSDWNEGTVNPYGDYIFPKSKSVSQTFNKTYSRPPVVFTSTSQMYTYKDKYVAFSTSLKEVTTKGFQLVCASQSSPNYLVGHLHISWISVSV